MCEYVVEESVNMFVKVVFDVLVAIVTGVVAIGTLWFKVLAAGMVLGAIACIFVYNFNVGKTLAAITILYWNAWKEVNVPWLDFVRCISVAVIGIVTCDPTRVVAAQGAEFELLAALYADAARAFRAELDKMEIEAKSAEESDATKKSAEEKDDEASDENDATEASAAPEIEPTGLMARVATIESTLATLQK